MNDGHMDIQEFWLKQLKKWSKEDLLGWGCFVWDWIWGICIFLKSRSNIEFSDINHHHLCHHFKPAAALLCSSTISGYWYQQAQASLCWPVPAPDILNGQTFCKTEEKRWYAKFCSSFTSSPSLIFYCKQISRLLFSLVDLWKSFIIRAQYQPLIVGCTKECVVIKWFF